MTYAPSIPAYRFDNMSGVERKLFEAAGGNVTQMQDTPERRERRQRRKHGIPDVPRRDDDYLDATKTWTDL